MPLKVGIIATFRGLLNSLFVNGNTNAYNGQFLPIYPVTSQEKGTTYLMA